MFGYYDLVVSSAQPDRSEVAGFRVPRGAKAECSIDAIRRGVNQGRTARHGRFVHCLALLLAASTAFLVSGSPNASAREQSDMFSDADGIEPPGMGRAYDTTAAYKSYVQRHREQKNRIAGHSDGKGDGRQKITHHKTDGNQKS